MCCAQFEIHQYRVKNGLPIDIEHVIIARTMGRKKPCVVLQQGLACILFDTSGKKIDFVKPMQMYTTVQAPFKSGFFTYLKYFVVHDQCKL
jgi:hypothetical protein